MGPLSWFLLLLAVVLSVLAWRTFRTSDDDAAASHIPFGQLNPPRRQPAPPPLARPKPLLASELVRLRPERAVQPLSSVGASQWHALADDFRRIRGPVVRADWQHTDAGDAWRICGGLPLANEDCERLCERAGAMLVVSPNVAATLSSDVTDDATPGQRWLRYLLAADAAPHDGAPDPQDDAPSRSVSDLPGSSVRACLACAAAEAPALEPVPEAPPLSGPGDGSARPDQDAFAARLAESLSRLDRERRAALLEGTTKPDDDG